MAKKKEDLVRIKPSYLIIPTVTLVAAMLGNLFTSEGMVWYDMLNKPAITPPDFVFGLVWLAIYITASAAAILAWEHLERDKEFTTLFLVFEMNVFFNIFFSFLLFYKQMFVPAIIDAAILSITAWIIFLILLRRASQVSLLILPYAIWATFATVLVYQVWLLNL